MRILERDIYGIIHVKHEFDFIIARLAIQHLNDIPRFLRVCSMILRPGGCLMVIEAEDRMTFFTPPLPSVDHLLESIRRKQALGGPQRALGVLRAHASSQGFFVVYDKGHAYQHKDQRGKVVGVAMFKNLSRLANQVYHISVDRMTLYKDLSRWQTVRQSRFQLGFRFLVLKKNTESMLNRLLATVGF